MGRLEKALDYLRAVVATGIPGEYKGVCAMSAANAVTGDMPFGVEVVHTSTDEIDRVLASRGVTIEREASCRLDRTEPEILERFLREPDIMLQRMVPGSEGKGVIGYIVHYEPNIDSSAPSHDIAILPTIDNDDLELFSPEQRSEIMAGGLPVLDAAVHGWVRVITGSDKLIAEGKREYEERERVLRLRLVSKLFGGEE